MSTIPPPSRPDDGDSILDFPLMSLREVVMFPRAIIPLFVGRKASIQAIETALAEHDKEIFLVTQRDANIEDPSRDDLYNVGTVSKILQMLKLPDGTIKVLFEGLYRAQLDGVQDMELAVPLAEVSALPEVDSRTPESEALVRATQDAIKEYARINQKLAKESVLAISTLNYPGRLADSVMPHLRLDFQKKQSVLEELHPLERLEKVYAHLQEEIEVYGLEKKIKTRVKKQMERNQKEYYLGEQLKAIHKEMGQDSDPQSELKELEEKLEALDMPDDARERGRDEIKKLRRIPPSSAEHGVIRNYVDWILGLPWNHIKEENIDIHEAQKILDEDHYGLKKAKERILEYLAVQSLMDRLKGPILCLVGPPGVGKTSLSKSIARAMGREFVRLSLGGVRDEAEIRGHRRTYVGALPGKIIQSLKRVDSNNPVFCLDEVDKMSTDFRGDPSAALLEVLDPEQNSAFNDHYLDLDYDLSKIFFITTANSLSAIPEPLQDRMEIIEIPGYLETEKTCIAMDFLLAKQLGANGLADIAVNMSKGAVQEIIQRYTREAGVRNLEREIASVCRKIARKIVEDPSRREKTLSVTKTNVHSYLGVPKVRHGEGEDRPLVGICTGLAWTRVGGELLLVEVALMPGSGKIEITGKLGDVMQESTRAALSYIRSRGEMFGLRSDFYKEIDIHVHVPEGATPKDGPSAGITLATSLVSALLHIPVRNDVAMTGEITLRGRVLPIGGLREKLLAAHRGGMKNVIIPADNEADLKEVPEAILKDIEITCVEHLDDVLCRALVDTSAETLFCGKGHIVPLASTLFQDDARVQPQ
ncbi:endopeptidase La [Desulfoplanes sp.]